MIDYIACGTGMLGVITTAMSEKWYGWAIGTFASACWTIHGIYTEQWALMGSGAFFVISQLIGLYRRTRADTWQGSVVGSANGTGIGKSPKRPIAYKFIRYEDE